MNKSCIILFVFAVVVLGIAAFLVSLVAWWWMHHHH